MYESPEGTLITQNKKICSISISKLFCSISRSKLCLLRSQEIYMFSSISRSKLFILFDLEIETIFCFKPFCSISESKPFCSIAKLKLRFVRSRNRTKWLRTKGFDLEIKQNLASISRSKPFILLDLKIEENI